MATSDINTSPLLSSLTTVSLPKMTVLETVPVKPARALCAHTGCRMKLGLLGFDCRCGAKYCSEHRHPEAHGCSYDHKATSTAILTKTLVGCVGDKMGGNRC